MKVQHRTAPFREAMGVIYRDLLDYGANGYIKDAKFSITDSNGFKYVYSLKIGKNHGQSEKLIVI